MTNIFFERKTQMGTWLPMSTGYQLSDQIVARRLDDYKNQFGDETVRARDQFGRLIDIR